MQQNIIMVWKNLFLGLTSCLASCSFALSQDLSGLMVYDEQGKKHEIHAVMKDSESFVILKDVFCIGCAEYLVDCSVSKKVLVVVERFSLLSISHFQPIRKAQLFFVSKSELIPDDFGANGIAVMQNEAFQIIREKEINELTRNYQEGIKTMRKRFKSYFQSKELDAAYAG